MNTIKWGMIGCGTITESESGPIFNKINNSCLIAVMDVDLRKAKDYAQKNRVAKSYDDANRLINDQDVNAIYIVTKPGSREELVMAAINAGKSIYVETPLSLSYSGAKELMLAATRNNIKLVMGHYLREQPLFKKVKELLDNNILGKIRIVNMFYYKNSITIQELSDLKMAWPLIVVPGLPRFLMKLRQINLIL